jgi:hypothetical protein
MFCVMSLLHELSEKVDSVATLSVATLSVATLSVATLSVATLSVATLFAPLFPKVEKVELDPRINRFIVKTGKIIFF